VPPLNLCNRAILPSHEPTPTMPLFWKPYRSDVTQFIDELKARKPTLEAEQRAGRARLWDRAQDRVAAADWDEAKVAQQPYVYQTEK
jgi:hypothetical protein